MKQKFKAILRKNEMGGHFVDVPFNVKETFGSKRPKIKALINGFEYRGSLVRMKTVNHILGVKKEIRDALKVQVGDVLTIEVELDTEERIVEIPPYFMEILIGENLLSQFENLSYTHRREYVGLIAEAKKPETRERRLDKAILALRTGKKLIG
jgi:uncharacterized protein YdeI (YjbR/CyaY-like superfamily)